MIFISFVIYIYIYTWKINSGLPQLWPIILRQPLHCRYRTNQILLCCLDWLHVVCKVSHERLHQLLIGVGRSYLCHRGAAGGEGSHWREPYFQQKNPSNFLYWKVLPNKGLQAEGEQNYINPLHPIAAKCAREISCPLHPIAAKCARISLPLLIVINAPFWTWG